MCVYSFHTQIYLQFLRLINGHKLLMIQNEKYEYLTTQVYNFQITIFITVTSFQYQQRQQSDRIYKNWYTSV